jgi:hypothetical protein
MSQPQHVCRSCGAPIQWAMTEKGKRMPVDLKPDERGNILLQHREGDVPLAVYLNDIEKQKLIDALDGRLQRHRLFLSHFVTCKHAAGWRKKGGN